jgi:hypothetical protein
MTTKLTPEKHVLDFDGIAIPNTGANLALWRIYHQPGIWILTLGHLERTARIKRLQRAAEEIRKIDPRLGATLRDLEFRGDWCRLVR